MNSPVPATPGSRATPRPSPPRSPTGRFCNPKCSCRCQSHTTHRHAVRGCGSSPNAAICRLAGVARERHHFHRNRSGGSPNAFTSFLESTSTMNFFEKPATTFSRNSCPAVTLDEIARRVHFVRAVHAHVNRGHVVKGHQRNTELLRKVPAGVGRRNAANRKAPS